MKTRKTLSVLFPWELAIQVRAGTFEVPQPPRLADLLVLEQILGPGQKTPDMAQVDVFLKAVIPTANPDEWSDEEKLEAVGFISEEISARKKKREKVMKTIADATDG